jgi:branched-chain amino acid transport system permease protein
LKNGAIYALMALTVVIIYKTTGHLNFAQGEMGTLGAFIIFVMVIEHGWSYWLAIPVALVFSFLLGAGIERTLIRPIERRSALGVVIVTLGIFLIINALNAAIWGTQQLSPLTPFPNLPDDQFVIAEGPPRFAVRYGAIGTWVALALVVAILWFFFQKTKLGLGYRAVASNRESSQLIGVPLGRMLMLGWAISAVLGTIAAIMVSQSASTLDFNLMATVLLYGFAAAALGGFDSIPGAVVGGLIVGMAEAFIPSFFSFVGSELSLAVALGVIVVVLLVRPEGLFGTKRIERV